MEKLYGLHRKEIIHRRVGARGMVMSLLEQIPPLEIGERLRLAREALNIKQAEAAEAIKVARTTIVAIEKGERRARMNELQLLARLYRTSVNALLRQGALQVVLS